MSFSHEYNFPLFVTSGTVKTSGHSSTLSPAEIGLFTEKDHQAITGAVGKWDALKVIQGSLHKVDKLGQYYGGMKKSDESPAFLVSDILEFHKSMPRKAQSEEWVIGWDGVSTTDTLSFECGKSYRFFVKVWGEDVYGTYLRPVQREIGITTDCCVGNDCTQTCDDTVAGKKWAKQIADAINNDPELKYFVEAKAIYSDAVDTAATHRLYTLTVPDDGSVLALSAVQAAEGAGFIVTLISRAGIMSTYQVTTVLDGPDGSPVAVPADFTPGSDITLAACHVCPTGYTTVPGIDVYEVTRPITPSTDLSTSGARQTYADSIGTAYKAADIATIPTTDVNTTTETITETAHNYVTGQKVTYSAASSTAITGLVDATVYYVIKVTADTFKLATTAANAFAGTAINLTGTGNNAQTFTPVVTATFLSQISSTAVVQLVTGHGSTLTALFSDSIELIRSTVDTCTPPANTAVAWVVGADRYKTTRTLHLTLEKECGTNNRLAALVAFYANVADVASAPTLTTAGTCSDIYTITQYNKELLEDGCLTNGVPTYDNLPTFEGFSWTAVPESAGSTSVKTGVRLKAAYTGGTQFGACSFHPGDYYSVRPLSLEVTDLVGGPGDPLVSPCQSIVPSRKIKYASMPTQSGEYVIREFIKANKYRINGEYFVDPRLREVLDTVASEVIDRNKTYVIYYFKIRAHRPTQNHVGDFSPEIYEMRVVAPLGTNLTTFESTLSNVASQNGVFLHNR